MAFRERLDAFKADQEKTEHAFLNSASRIEHVGAWVLLTEHFRLPVERLKDLREHAEARFGPRLENLASTRISNPDEIGRAAFGSRLEEVKNDPALLDRLVDEGTFRERMGALALLSFRGNLSEEKRIAIASRLWQDDDERVRAAALNFESQPYRHSGNREQCRRYARIALDETQPEQIRITAAFVARSIWLPNPLAILQQRRDRPLNAEERQAWMDARTAIAKLYELRFASLMDQDWDWLREFAI